MAKQPEKMNANEHGTRKPVSQPGEAQPHSPKPLAESDKGGGQSGFLRRSLLVLLIGLAIVVCSFFGVRWIHYNMTHVTTDDARVKGDLVTVSSSVQGRIRLLSFQEGDRVEAGQVIAQLHDEDYRAQVEMASAAVRAVEAEIKEADALLAVERQKVRKDIGLETAGLDAARARLETLQAGQRSGRLQSKTSNQDYIIYEVNPFYEQEPGHGRSNDGDAIRRQLEDAKAEVKEREARLQAAKTAGPAMQQVTAAERRIEALKARLTEARAGLVSAELKLAAATITSPISGVLARKAANMGEIVLPGQTIAAIANLDHLWIEAYLEQKEFERVRPVQIADLKVEAYPGSVFTGKVVSIGAFAASESSPVAENSSTGDFTQMTQRIPVRIEVSDVAHLLRPGMMVSVGIDLRTGKDHSTSKQIMSMTFVRVGPVLSSRPRGSNRL